MRRAVGKVISHRRKCASFTTIASDVCSMRLAGVSKLFAMIENTSRSPSAVVT
jgi:hypothetical protein